MVGSDTFTAAGAERVERGCVSGEAAGPGALVAGRALGGSGFGWLVGFARVALV